MPDFRQFKDVISGFFAAPPPRIRDLTVDQTASYAGRVFKREGRSTLTARFVYHALKLDSQHPQALVCLSDFLRSGTREDKPSDMLAYAAIILERARNALKRSGQLSRELETARLRLLWEWGFAVYVKDPAGLPPDFNDASQFNIDELAVVGTISTNLQRLGTPEKAFEAIHRIIGLRAQFLRPRMPPFWKKKTAEAHPPDYEETGAYSDWLQTDLKSLAGY